MISLEVREQASPRPQTALWALEKRTDFILSTMGRAFRRGVAVSVSSLSKIILPPLWRMDWKKARLEGGGFCSLLEERKMVLVG